MNNPTPVPAGLNEKIIIDHRRLANKEDKFPDVICAVDEKYTVVGHEFILAERIPTLFTANPALKKKKKTKKNVTLIEFNKSENITPEAVHRMMVYAYCGQVDYRTFTPSKAVEVIHAAEIFKLDRLYQMCQKYLQLTLTIENIFKLLKYTESLNVEKAKQICMEFALGKDEFFVSASEQSLGFKLYKDVTIEAFKAHQGQKKEATEILVTAEDTIVEDFKKIYASHSTKDVCFLIQGVEVKAHKPLLIDQSLELAALANNEEARDQKKASEFRGQVIILDEKYSNISPDAFESMLRLIYYNDENIEMLHACQLYLFAHDYNLVKLSLLIEKIISGGEVTCKTVLPLLDVAYNPLMEQNKELQPMLKEIGMKFVVQNIEKMDFGPLQHMSPVIGTQILQHIQSVFSRDWRSMVQTASNNFTSLPHPHDTSSDSPLSGHSNSLVSRTSDLNIAKSKGSQQDIEETSDSDILKSKSDPKLKNKGSESARKPKSKQPTSGKKEQPPTLNKKKKT